MKQCRKQKIVQKKNDLLNTCTKEQSFHLGVGDIYKIVIATQWILLI